MHVSSSDNALLNSNGFQTVFKCDPNQDPSPSSARRLSKAELINSLHLLLSPLPSNDQTTIKNIMYGLYPSIPDDNALKFANDDTSITESHTSGYFVVAKGLAAELTKTNARMSAIFGACATTTSFADACADAFLSQGADQILRRPLTATEKIDFIAKMKTFSTQRAQWLLTRLLMHPNFLFQIELEGTEQKLDLLKITPYELASRISFHVVKQSPDRALLSKAADGSIMNEAVIKAEVQRLVASYPIQASYSVDHFFDGWLAYKNIAHPASGATPAEVAFAEGAKLSRQSLINEVTNMSRYYMNEGRGSFEDFFLSPYSFASDNDLANLYGVAKWDPVAKQMVAFPQGQRAGLLGRAAFLVSGNVGTSPIIRGLMVRRQFLCEELTPPPTNIANMVRDPVFDPTISTRQRYHEKTNSTACMGCHTQINPLGFALESYDAFGRFRTMEKVYDATSGQLLNQIPVDPVVQPLISPQDSRSIASSDQFNQLIAQSGKARGCMVGSFFNYAFHRQPDNIKDGCALRDLDDAVSSQEGLKKIFYDSVTQKAFLYRKLD